MNIQTRRMMAADCTSVIAIERASFACPWTLAGLVRKLRPEEKIVNGRVAVHNGRVIGHVVYELSRTRIELLTLAVDPIFRRRGAASLLIGDMTKKLSYERRRVLSLEVAERNLPACQFLRSQGFRWTKTIPHRFCNGESAYRFGLPFGACAMRASTVSLTPTHGENDA